MVGLLGVGLVETLGPHFEFQVFHGFVDEVGAFESGDFQIADGVVAFLIVHIDKRTDLGKPVGKMLQQLVGPVLVARLVVVELHQ